MTIEEKPVSAQVNMLAKMRTELKKESALEGLLKNAKQEKRNKIVDSPAPLKDAEKYSNSGKLLIEVDPKICRPWAFADRNSYEMGNIEELANSIKTNGQEVPALLRELPAPDGDIKYEVIYGHRRWKACSLINKPLKANLKKIDDKESAIAQILENNNRENLSDYSRAMNYHRLIKSKTFSSKVELAAQIGIPRTTLNDIMSFAELPENLLTALKTPEKLPTRTAVALSSLCKNATPDQLNQLCQMAPKIVSGAIPYKKLKAGLFVKTDNQNHNESSKDKKVFSNNLNVKLFTSGLNQNKAPSLTFHKIVIDNNLLPEIEELVFNYLKDKT